jgi:hypothetical protein
MHTMAKRAAPRGQAARLKAMRELCAALAPRDAALARAVELAVTDPEGYVAKYGGENVDEPFPALPWYVLAGALADRRRCLQIDWKHPPDDAFAQLKGLRGAPLALKRLDGRDLGIDDLDTGQFLEVAGRALRERSEVTLAAIDTASDSYSLVLIPTKQAKSVAAIAARAGGEIEPFTGAELADFTRFRRARETREDRRWYRETPHFLRGEGARTKVTHLMWTGAAYAVLRHDITAACREIKHRELATAAERRRAVAAEIQALLRVGWRRVQRSEYIATYQRFAGSVRGAL